MKARARAAATSEYKAVGHEEYVFGTLAVTKRTVISRSALVLAVHRKPSLAANKTREFWRANNVDQDKVKYENDMSHVISPSTLGLIR